MDGSVEKYKVRSIAKGFSQTKGVVYDDPLDPVSLIHFHPYYHPWVGNYIRWMDSWWVWVSERVFLIQTYIITLLVMRAWFWWLIQEVMLLDTSKLWLLISRWRIWVWCTTSWDKKYDRGLMRFFLSEGKYTVGILKKFNMTRCKSMTTPMVMDLKKMNDDDSIDIDP